MKSLESLAKDLHHCRRRHHKLSLKYVLEAARILSDAKRLAKRRFGAWLREHARMDRSTVGRYLRVAAFAKANESSMHQIQALSIMKICSLASLDAAAARRFLKGTLKLSGPLEELGDAQFVRELRARYPAPPKKLNRQHAYRQVLSAIARLERAFSGADRYHDLLSPAQKRQIADEIRELIHMARGWRRIA